MSALPSGNQSMAELVAIFRRRRAAEGLTAVEAAVELTNSLPDAQLRVAVVLTRAFELHPMDAWDRAAETFHARVGAHASVRSDE